MGKAEQPCAGCICLVFFDEETSEAGDRPAKAQISLPAKRDTL